MPSIFSKSFYTKEKIQQLCIAFILLFLALIFQYYTTNYSASVSSIAVPDLILGHLPIVNVNIVIVEGALLAILFSIVLLLAKPRYIVCTLKTAAIFIATRAIFVSLTHLGIYPGQIGPDNGFFDRIYSALGLGDGFFFSSHTGLPFLMALIFWNEKLWRYMFLAISAIFGVCVLLAHVHYSIDVFAAPYITYAIYKMSEYFFKEDYKEIKA